MVKVITKRIHERLDNFVNQNQSQFDQESQAVVSTSEGKPRKTVRKNNDGLIERVELSKKIFIAEDNRQLLSD